VTTLLADQPARPDRAAGAPSRRWTGWNAGLAVLGAGAAVLTTWAVWNGSRSDYYASIALSMSRNWSNFFFGAMDPAGTVTLDKVPGSFWVPALFVKLFGFSTWAVVLPNALAAVGAVVLVAVTARRLMSPTAGLVAGAVVATTPILLAVARSNQPETFFVLGLAAAACAASLALTRLSFWWLIITGLVVAASFQTYMLEAWAVWPALATAWLCTRQPWLRKLWTVAVAGTVSLATSLWWVAVVSLVPAGSRPYIGSTLGNSAWEMVFGYNGLGRFGDATADTAAYRSFTPPFSGEPGVLRLSNPQLAGQIGWMLPVAVAALVVLWVLRFSRAVTVLLTVWFATFATVFSIVAGMHQFYTAALSIPVALSIGLAFGAARRRRTAWPQLLLLAVAATTALAIGFGYGGYSVPLAIMQAALAVGAGVLVVWDRRGAGRPRWWVGGAAGAALLLTPLVWSAVSIAHPSASNPVAGGVADIGFVPDGGTGTPSWPPGALAGGRTLGTPGTAPGASTRGPGEFGSMDDVLAYLDVHAIGRTYLAATFGAQTAAEYIIASDGASFLPIGGFNGGDPVPTLAAFQRLVSEGRLSYVIVSNGFAGGAGESTTSGRIRAWVQSECTVPSDSPSSSLYACGD
jgi:4-amino-4-deoxy-L-arabinose transferase-like glycosyltransferase